MFGDHKPKYRNFITLFSFIALVLGSLIFVSSTNKTKAKNNNERNVTGGTTFPGTGTGAIPDGGPGCGAPAATNLDITFAVSGISSPGEISVAMTTTHTWVGDVSATLIAPSGESHVLVKNTGWTSSTSACGDSSDLGGVYTFSDSASGTNWWAEASTRAGAETLTPGAYRTTEAGGASQTQNPAPVTVMNSVFAGANFNGTWTLRVNDSGGGDTGSVTAASITITPSVPPNPPIDFDGDGKSAYSIVRNITPGLSETVTSRRSIEQMNEDPGFKSLPHDPAGLGSAGSNLGWYISQTASGTPLVTGFGNPTTDSWVPEDYDGDGKDDIAIWRGVAATGPGGGFFYVLRSSDSTVSETDFGVTGDNPTVVGDYDGDQKADPAVFRCPPTPGGQCTFYYKGSSANPGGNITAINWGNNSSSTARPYPGDFDGDGKYDFCVFNSGQYVLLRSSDFGVEWINWGLATDPVLAPGDYDGDGKTDFMNVRVAGSDVQWWLLSRTGAASTTVWGAVGIAGFSEFATPGDFDGDGKVDIGVWRRNNGGPSGSIFYTLRSSDGMLEAFEWGSSGDAPVPGWNGN